MKNNPQLLEYSGIWSDFIPEDQIKSFQRGGYFAIDVAPGIRVLSLNTLYFFGSNDLVNTCSDKESAGHRHVKWMRKEFKRARNDGVKVIVMGHVPPTVKTFKDSCLDDYIKLSIKFEDIIMGHMYGHSNMDHFQVLSRGAIKNSLSVEKDHADMDITRDTGRFVSTLHDQYKKVKKVRDSEKLVVVHVAPPMLPLFFPTFRINEYEANRSSSHFGDWLQYTQWFTNLTYWNEARHPVTDKHLSPQFEIEYSTNETYGMTDLTSERWLDFAEELASKEDKKMWKTYLANMFVQTNNDWYGQSIDPPTGDMTWWDWFWSSIQQTIKNKFL
jgi:hypothetical protein